MPKFLTIFPSADNVHLIKDIGMIPFVLHKEYGYDATIACYNNGEYPYLDTDVKGLKMVFIKKIFKNDLINVCWFIITNFWKYDIVQCYHISIDSIISLLLFKLISFSKGVTYLKFDANDSMKNQPISRKVTSILNFFDVLSVETLSLCKYLNQEHLFNGKVKYIPSGYYSVTDKQNIEFNFKDNLIITVGRIGSAEKNNETLLQAFKEFAKIKLDWNLELIGPISDGFQPYIKSYFEDNPQLISRVAFTGNISNRQLVQQKFEKAKIFVLTSPSESFGIVIVEALASGCYIVCTNFSSAYDITDNERFGSLFDFGNTNFLTKKLFELAEDQQLLSKECQTQQEFAKDSFSWKKICKNIDTLLRDSI